MFAQKRCVRCAYRSCLACKAVDFRDTEEQKKLSRKTIIQVIQKLDKSKSRRKADGSEFWSPHEEILRSKVEEMKILKRALLVFASFVVAEFAGWDSNTELRLNSLQIIFHPNFRSERICLSEIHTAKSKKSTFSSKSPSSKTKRFFSSRNEKHYRW